MSTADDATAPDALRVALGELEVATAGELRLGPMIDHVAMDTSLRVLGREVLCQDAPGLRLSDHHGVVVELSQV